MVHLVHPRKHTIKIYHVSLFVRRKVCLQCERSHLGAVHSKLGRCGLASFAPFILDPISSGECFGACERYKCYANNGLTQQVFFNVEFFQQLLFLISLVNVVLAVIVYHYVIRQQRGYIAALLMTYGVAIPFALVSPFRLARLLDVRNTALLIGLGGPQLLTFLRCLEGEFICCLNSCSEIMHVSAPRLKCCFFLSHIFGCK